jgi:integrase
MQPATILRIHSIISSALDLAVRYDWADRNVAKNASPPHPRKREPDPPSPDQAARLLNLVWTEDAEFGLYLWTAFTTGARRGEVSALRENRFDFARQQVRLARNYLVKQGQHIEKTPKDGEGRVLSLDHDLEVLRPVHTPCRPGGRHRYPLPARRPPQERNGSASCTSSTCRLPAPTS